MYGKIIAFLFIAVISTVRGECDYYDDGDCATDAPSCVFSDCHLPNCSCFGVQPSINVDYRPQLVMLTFDDAITVSNIDTYRKIVDQRRNKRNNEPIKLTFFVCHEYNDYELTHDLYAEGHEIAVHSISHESNTDLWRRGSPSKWKAEMTGMRTILTTFGHIPPREILGHRAPFLQTAGDTTFEMLKKEGFLYDSSMPTRSFRDPPIWPYTLDYGYSQDCQIEPCPRKNIPGLWEIPMVQYEMKSSEGMFYCSMVDACTPQPKTRWETKAYLLHNFRRHYLSNKAPFPVFLHEAWLQDKERLAGYLDFLDDILKNDDVFIVTVRDVIEYMKNPVKYSSYFAYKHEKPINSCNDAKICRYKEPLRNMKSCSPCPPYYPWLGTPLGRRKPTLQ